MQCRAEVCVERYVARDPLTQRTVIGMRLFSRTPGFTLVFIHMPKTGGMSMRQILLRECARPTFWIVDPVRDTAELRSKPVEERGRLTLVEGHMYYGVHEFLPRPCVYMTVLRDPVERVLSYYSHVREREEHHLHEAMRGLSLSECIRRGMTVELDNYMTRALTSLRNVGVPFGGVTAEMLSEAKSHLEGMYVGLTERMEESVAYFRSVLGWRRREVPRMNVTAARVRRQDLPLSEVEAIRAANALDLELYDSGKRLFETRWTESQTEHATTVA